MKLGVQDRKKAITAAVLGVLAVGLAAYNLIDFGGSSSTPTTPAPVPATTQQLARGPVAQRVSASRLDPTLHPEGMLLAEQLVYAGSGRNIFTGMAAEPAAVRIPRPIIPVRTTIVAAPLPQGPPPIPPIDLRFFGIITRDDGTRRAFFLQGDDVLIASSGDIVSRRYKVGAIAPTSVEVTDLTNNNNQRLPLVLQ